MESATARLWGLGLVHGMPFTNLNEHLQPSPIRLSAQITPGAGLRPSAMRTS